MTKSTITREQLEEWVAQFDEDGGCDATDRQLEALIRQSLAAMDREPVAEVVSIYGDHEAFGEREIRPLVGIQQMPYGTKLYRHAQPAPESQLSRIWAESYQVVGALAEALCIFNDIGVIKALDNLSAQELIHDDVLPFSVPEEIQPATVPGKWIPVSERRPFDEIATLPKPMGGPFLVAYSSGAVDISWYSCRQDITGRRGEWDGETGTLAIAMGRGAITHWMPLPAAPQEGSQ